LYEDKNGKIKQLSTYDEKNYFLVNTENDKIELKIKLLVDKDKIIRQVKEMEKRLIKVDVIEIGNTWQRIFKVKSIINDSI
jgi:acetolactate synthase small subunit